MPSLAEYRNRFGGPVTSGQAKKYESDLIMNNTWWEDPQAQVGYIYDYYHDDEPLVLRGLKPQHTKKTHVDVKLIVNSYNSENKDQVGYHIQFRPGFKCPLPYYKEQFEDKWNSEFPIGLYIDLMDPNGVYRKWLITENANQLGNQFPTYYVLPCDFIFRWVHRGKKYELAGVTRSQNSYNSGAWEDYKFSTPQNQKKCVLPMNDVSTTIFYDQRIALSANIEEPVVWICTKVEQIGPKGINRLTFAQDKWDENRDFVEYDSSGKCVGIWCDYFTGNSDLVPENTPEPPIIPDTEYAKVTFAGKKAQLKVGGSYKKFTVLFYRNDEQTDFKTGSWSYLIDGKDAGSDLIVLTKDDDDTIKENEVKVKIPKDDSYIGKLLTVRYVSDDGISAEVETEIVAL